MPFVPGMTSNFGITCYLPGRIQVSPMLHWSGRIYDSSSKTQRNAFNARELLNIMASKEINSPGSTTSTIFVKFYNVTNNKFNMPWQFRDPGFQGTVGVIMEL